MKNKTIWIVVAVVVLGGLLFWAGSTNRPNPSTGDVVATNGIHWHPTLTIYVDGEKQTLPANIGLINGHSPIHTHGEDVENGVLHFEFSNTVRTSDLQLKNFFQIWDDKDILTAFGTLESMSVNGEDNTEYGEYVVGEHDSVELFYTTNLNSEDVGDDTTMEVPAPDVDPNLVDEMIVNTDSAGTE